MVMHEMHDRVTMQNGLPHGCLVADTQAVGAALVCFIVHGSSFSAAFDAHGSRSGQLPGLRQGWLFGRSVVSIVISAACQ